MRNKIDTNEDSKKMQKAAVHVSGYACGPHGLISDASKIQFIFYFLFYLVLKLRPPPYQF